MCKERSSVEGLVVVDGEVKHIRVDKCIRHLPFVLSQSGFNVVACCCGHGRYPLTIICKTSSFDLYFDLISGKNVPRKKRFYVRDKKGYFYIPEVSQEVNL